MRPALLAGSILLAAGALYAHSASDCHLFVDVVDQHNVRLSVTLKASDIIDLFGIDLTQPGAVDQVRSRAHRDATTWFKLRDDRGTCAVQDAEVTGDSTLVSIVQPYACKKADGPLRLDWGLSSISSLKLAAHAKVRRRGKEVFAQDLTRSTPTLKIPERKGRSQGTYVAVAMLFAVAIVSSLGRGRKARS